MQTEIALGDNLKFSELRKKFKMLLKKKLKKHPIYHGTKNN